MVTGIRFGRRVADAIGDLIIEEETPGAISIPTNN